MSKKILITGGLGFIGSNFVEHVVQKNKTTEITVYDAKTYCVSENTQAYLTSLVKNKAGRTIDFVIEDINDFNLDTNKFDIIVNFAAESHVDNSIQDASGVFIKTNIGGVNKILQKCLKDNFKGRFVQISTDEVYGSLSLYQDSCTESSPLNPSSIYSSTKASSDMVAMSYYKTHGLDVIITRCCNNFGPRQYTEKLIPVVIHKAMNDEKIPVYGSGKNVREWIFVKDHCEQIYDVALYGTSGEIYNIAPTYETTSELSNIVIVKKILDNLGKSYDLIEYVDDRLGHDVRYSLSGSKVDLLRARNGLAKNKNIYTFEKTFDDDLTLTIKWYKRYPKWWDPDYKFEL